MHIDGMHAPRRDSFGTKSTEIGSTCGKALKTFIIKKSHSISIFRRGRKYAIYSFA
jgi:hypothetical protein